MCLTSLIEEKNRVLSVDSVSYSQFASAIPHKSHLNLKRSPDVWVPLHSADRPITRSQSSTLLSSVFVLFLCDCLNKYPATLSGVLRTYPRTRLRVAGATPVNVLLRTLLRPSSARVPLKAFFDMLLSSSG